MTLPADVLLLFFTTSLLLGLTPGPDNLFVLSQSLVFGARAGLLVVLGLCTGLIFHTLLVTLGVAAMIAASEQLLGLVKVAGALYLLYLAVLSWRDTGQTETCRNQLGLTSIQLYRRGIIMNATNPKVGLFFLAFLPQFIDESYGAVTPQVITLGLLFILSTVFVFGSIAILAGRYSETLKKSIRRRLLLNRLVSIIFLLLALNLFFNIF